MRRPADEMANEGRNRWLRRFVATAELEAAESGHDVVDGRHFMLAATRRESRAVAILESAGVDPHGLRLVAARVGPPPTKAPGAKSRPAALGADAGGILAVARDEARAAGQEVGPAHVLVGLAKVHVAFGAFDVFTNDIRRATGLPVPDAAPPPAVPRRLPRRTGRLVIDGGGDTATRVAAVVGLVRSSNPTPTVAFVGAACPWWGPPRGLERAVARAGGRLVDVGASQAEDAAGKVAEAEVVHLAGGFHRYLVDYLASGPVGEALVRASDAGAVVWGASAGAIALGTGGVDLSGDDGPTVSPGLGWLDVDVLPHFQGKWDDVLTPRAVQVRVEATGTVDRRVLLVPHEGAVLAHPGWQELSGLPPFPVHIGAWWWRADEAPRRIA